MPIDENDLIKFEIQELEIIFAALVFRASQIEDQHINSKSALAGEVLMRKINELNILSDKIKEFLCRI